MKRLINWINDIDMDQTTEDIINGELYKNTLPFKIQEFNLLNNEEQHTYMNKLSERIRQITKPYKLLTVMLFIDTLMKSNSKIALPAIEYPNLILNKSKQHIILVNIAKYYEYFLKLNEANKYNKETINVEEQLQEAENYCQLVILKITELLKIDFIFTKGWTKLEDHKYLLRQIVTSILDRFKSDLFIMCTFVKNNLELVLQKTVKHPLAFNINHIYEKLIAINKEMKKLQKLAKLYLISPIFPRYQIDIDINREVQMEMLERKQEKKEFYKNLHNQKQYEDYLSQAEVITTESFLLLNSHDLDD